MAAEDVLHDLGAISMIGSDSQAMGRIGETVIRTWQTAHVMKGRRGPLSTAGDPADNLRARRYVAKYVTLDGVPLLRHELPLPDPAFYTSSAVLGDARCTGDVLLVGPDLARDAYAADGPAVMPLAGPGVLVTALAPDSAILRQRLVQGEKHARG